MRSSEFDEILASLQDVVHRAYVLGRSDALKHMVEVMQSDESLRKPLALMAPEEPPASLEPEGSSARAEQMREMPQEVRPASPGEQPAKAWWARPPRSDTTIR